MIHVKPVVESVSPIPVVEQIPAATPAPIEVTHTSKVEPLSKNAYDSLAPLNVPSKPVVYVNVNPEQEATAAESVSQTDTKPSQGQETSDLNSKTDAATSDTSDTSRMDEKAKLESILMSSMSQTSSAYKQGGDGASMSLNNNGGPHKHKFSAGNVGSMGNNNGTNGPTNIGNWPPRMPMTPSRLPPNYLCTICKKPGHLKSLCPEAVIIRKKKDTIIYSMNM